MQQPTSQERLEHLTHSLVLHLRDLLDQYPEGAVLLPQQDGELSAWSARVPGFPGPIAVGVCARAALDGPLSHAVEEAHDGGGVLVVCDVTDTATGDARAVIQLPDDTDVVEVHHPSEIAGAVIEALAGDVPLVLDVRLSPEEGAAMFSSGRNARQNSAVSPRAT